MEIYRVGERIKEERIRRNLSQEELCHGVCAVVTLSRIENGMQKPSLKVEEALLEKLGCSTENLVFYASHEEVEKHKLELELTVLAMHRQPIGDKLEQYKKLINVKDAGNRVDLERQFALTIEAVHALYARTWEVDRVSDQLEEALSISIPNYKERGVKAVKLLTNTEITIINNLAIAFDRKGETEQAVKLLYYLVTYIENGNLNIDTTGKKYPMLVYNIARMMDKLKNFTGMLQMCEKGIAFCKKYGRLAVLSGLYYYKAVAYTELGRLEEAAESYEYAICLCKITDKADLAEQVQAEWEILLKRGHNNSQSQHGTAPQQD